ncbi:MAG: Sapep family Mn(2+)-dependent dipeptidase [Oscillospiraceae bacterium]|nr:Sapep family Mn(2+)-dependent dipeptidase [Oscillospiraceae bacterium]MDD6084999.1 Sapep family Mn(2+)-dependent dipeptidase [Oscillospiraceae bacterium]MDY3257717.1 Sapep family Mn(2+)-dependent dipeptidase [Ruminococcus callidus]
MKKIELNKYIEKEFDSIISDLKDIIAIKSVSIKSDNKKMPFGSECAKVLEVFLKKAENMGFKTNNIDNYAGTISFDEKDPELGILCHLDVVPADESGWTVTKPFESIVKDDRIYGRGAIDDKGPAIAVLYAMKIIKEMDIKLKKGLKFIVGCDEENGSSDMEYYRKKESFPKYVFTPDGDFPVINFEKGMLRVKFSRNVENSKVTSICGGNIINAVPEKAKAMLSSGLVINENGKSAHASTPQRGDNALTKLIDTLSKNTNETVWKNIAKLFPYGENNGRGLGIYSKDDETGETTCVFSVAEIKNNHFEGYFDVRFPKNVKIEEITKKIKDKLVENGFDCEFVLKEDYHYVSSDSEFVKKLLNVYENETGEKASPLAIGGGTYVHDIDGGVAFGAEFPGENNNMHGNDEFIKIDSLKKSIRLYINAILEICG